MKTTIEITLTEPQWALYQRDPNVLGAWVWWLEGAIRTEHGQSGPGRPWEDINARLLSPTGDLIREVTWAPLSYLQKKARKPGRRAVRS